LGDGDGENSTKGSNGTATKGTTLIITMSDPVYECNITDHTCQIDLESELFCTLSPNKATPKCFMTIRHGRGTEWCIMFKVKTT